MTQNDQTFVWQALAECTEETNEAFLEFSNQIREQLHDRQCANHEGEKFAKVMWGPNGTAEILGALHRLNLRNKRKDKWKKRR